MPGDKNLGVTLSRTLIPPLPADYLSRKRLFPLIANQAAGTTFVIAPDGYGKTSLVAEWAQNQSTPVIWMTVTNSDTLNEMSAMMILATRQVVPGFAPWFEQDQPIRPTDVVRRWGNDLLQTGRDYIFVLDNLRTEDDQDVKIETQLIEQFPNNIHFVAIRRDAIEEIYSICASRGPIKVLSTQELRFTDEEIELIAANHEIKLDEDSRKVMQAAHGWPAATSLILENLKSHTGGIDLAQLMSSTTHPLRELALMVIDNLDPTIATVCEKLSILESFTLDVAKVILGDENSVNLINSIAHKGEIFTLSRVSSVGYTFSPMVREIFLENLRKRGNLKADLHQKLIEYFERRGRVSDAIIQAFEAGDEEKISQLFPNAARMKQAQGKGGELIRWAHHLDTSRVDGELKRSTVLATGYLADLDYSSAQLEINRINHLADRSEGASFFKQFALAASCYALLTNWRYEELESKISELNIGTPHCYLGVDDQINLLRLLVTKRFILSDPEGVEEVFLLAQKLGRETSLDTSHAFLLGMEAIHLQQRGEFRRSHELSTVALSQYQRFGFVGNHGALEVLNVLARTNLEFSKITQALALLEQLRENAYQWKQWHWYFAADYHVIQILTYLGNYKEAQERIKRSRDFLKSAELPSQLSMLIDLNELVVRRKLNDFDRLEILLSRLPKTRDTQVYQMFVDEHFGRKIINENAKNLPEKTPREQMWKYLTEASLNIDSESIALPAMEKALKIGAEVGSRETFLRQSDEMGNLIIRIANQHPTVYNEELASAMAERIRERGEFMKSDQTSLTKRELEILRQLSTGRTLTLIAAELHISQNTMKTHLKNLYRKLGADGRNDAVEKGKAAFLI